MMTTNDEALNKKLLALRVHGSEERYFHKWVGLNSRLDGFQGAVLRTKLPHLETWTERRRANAARYHSLFTDAGLTEEIVLPYERPDARHIYNQFVVRVPGRRDELKAYLADNGVGTDIYYPVSLHLQECFSYLGYRKDQFPESERASRETLALPIFPELVPEQIEYVVQTISQFFRQSTPNVRAA
jgi:dTDP-4-amino-4,6-dideoxygalactose transaminase